MKSSHMHSDENHGHGDVYQQGVRREQDIYVLVLGTECLSPFICWNPNSSVMIFVKRGLGQVIKSWGGLVPSKEEARELVSILSIMCGYNKKMAI